MKKLTNQQIEQVNQRLITYGFGFIDIRIEVLDHLLCLLEAKESNDFEANLNAVFTEQNNYLKTIKKSTLSKILNKKTLLSDFIINPIFWIIWGASFLFLFYINSYITTFPISNLTMVPFQLVSIPITFYLIYFFISKRKSTDSFSNFFTVSYLLYGYLLLVSYFKESSGLTLIGFISFGIATSLMLYYLLVYYKIKNDKKYQTLFQ